MVLCVDHLTFHANLTVVPRADSKFSAAFARGRIDQARFPAVTKRNAACRNATLWTIQKCVYRNATYTHSFSSETSR